MKTTSSPKLILRILLCFIILAIGAGGFIFLKKMKKPPRQAEVTEQSLPVQILQVHPVRVPVILSGYGEITSRTVVPVSAEVNGRVTQTHPDLQVGAVIKKDEMLCIIDDRDYRIELATAEHRITILTRDVALARKDYLRIKALYTKKNVGTQAKVEIAESKVNSIANQLSVVMQTRDMARLRLERCTIKAPFSGRISSLEIEKDEYVTVGRKLFTLIDDSDLEIQVALDSREGIKWLRFHPSAPGQSWFGTPEETPCTVTWTEQPAMKYQGILDRVVRFDSHTRTLVTAVKILPGSDQNTPLVTGMFCRVDFSGPDLPNVFLLPRQAVSFEGIVYVVQDNRLHSRKVTIAREQNGKVLVTDGLKGGEVIITTRLENPLENTLVRTEQDKESQQ